MTSSPFTKFIYESAYHWKEFMKVMGNLYLTSPCSSVKNLAKNFCLALKTGMVSIGVIGFFKKIFLHPSSSSLSLTTSSGIALSPDYGLFIIPGQNPRVPAMTVTDLDFKKTKNFKKTKICI